jgi:hypothetical protein
LLDLFAYLFFGVLACRSVTNIALDYPGAIHPVHVADKLDIDAPPTLGLKRQVFIADIFPALLR